MDFISKLFESSLKNIHCSQLPFHPNETCLKSLLNDMYIFTKSGLVYYSPLILTPIILKGTQISKENVLDILKFYLETVLVSTSSGCIVFGLICFFRNIFGEFRIGTTLVLPGFLAAQTCWFYSKRTLRIFFITNTQVVLEALLRQNKNVFTNCVLNSKLIQTIIFMTSSAIIMHFKRLRLYNGFWFIKPEIMQSEKPDDKENANDFQKCEQTTNWKCLLRGMKTYAIYGLSLDVLSTILKRYRLYKTRGLSHMLWESLKGTRLQMTCFFMSYVGVYKLVFHCLPKYMAGILSTDSQHAIAAFLGGVSYVFLNKLTYNTLALSLAVQILWRDFCQKNDTTAQKYRFLRILKEFPFMQALFPFFISHLIYSFFACPDTVNSLGKNLIRAVTGQKIQLMFDYISKHDLEYLIKDTAMKPSVAAF